MKNSILILAGCILLTSFPTSALAISLEDLRGTYQSMLYMGLNVEINGNQAISNGFKGSNPARAGFSKGRILISNISSTAVPPKSKGGGHIFSARCSTIEGEGPFQDANCILSATRDSRGNVGFNVSLHASEQKGGQWPKILGGRFNRIQQ